MAEFPCLPLWTDAYLGDTTHLTTVEHGAYFLLLMAMWRSKNKSLPDDDRFLARITRTTQAQWARIRPTLIVFFDLQDGVLSNGRLSDEWHAVKQNSKRQSSKAKARWLKVKETGNAVAVPQQSPTDASLTLTTTPLAKAKTRNPKPPASDTPEFIQFWAAYPRRVSKADARAAFFKALEKQPAQRLIDAAGSFAKQCNGQDQKFIPHPSTWLNGERWADEPYEAEEEVWGPWKK